MIKKLTAKAVDEDPAGCPGGEGTLYGGLHGLLFSLQVFMKG